MTATTINKPFTVADFIAFLQTQDQGATVAVLGGHEGHFYEPDYYTFEDFTPEAFEYTDLRGNQFVSADSPSFNARTVYIGREA